MTPQPATCDFVHFIFSGCGRGGKRTTRHEKPRAEGINAGHATHSGWWVSAPRGSTSQGDDVQPDGCRWPTLTCRKPIVTRLTAIIDFGGFRLWAVGELDQQIKDLRIPVLSDQPVDVVAPAAPARLANDRQRRLADVREGESVFCHRRMMALRRERS